MNPSPALTLSGLRKSYAGKEVVRGLDLSIYRGECFGLLGPNGAGKTTTLRLCLGLTTPDSGNITVLDQAIPMFARQTRIRIGVVPQFDSLDPDFSICENLLIFGRYFDIPDAMLNSRIPDLLEFAGLSNRGDAGIRSLSGGMKRRLSLARALINDPELIFLDEPTTGLDPQARHIIWERLRQLLKMGKTLLLTTHFMEEAERLCQRIAIIDHGTLIAVGEPQTLIGQHIEPQVVEVFGDGAAAWATQHAAQLADRCENTGETYFLYSRDPAALIVELERSKTLRFLHRRASLEDVFLKLTGRELRD